MVRAASPASQIRKEGFVWRRLGVDTLRAADAYLRKQATLRTCTAAVLPPLLGITGRAPVEAERKYIAAWLDMGFEDGAIRLAYERTVLQRANELALSQLHPGRAGTRRAAHRGPGPGWRFPTGPGLLSRTPAHAHASRGGRPPGGGGPGADAGIPTPAERRSQGRLSHGIRLQCAPPGHPAALRGAAAPGGRCRTAAGLRIYQKLPQVAQIDQQLRCTIVGHHRRLPCALGTTPPPPSGRSSAKPGPSGTPDPAASGKRLSRRRPGCPFRLPHLGGYRLVGANMCLLSEKLSPEEQIREPPSSWTWGAVL